MLLTYVALGSLLLATPLLGLAQTAQPTPHFYVGLSAYHISPQNFDNVQDANTALPIQATLGYQLRPRLAVQLSAVYSRGQASASEAYSYADANADQIKYTTAYAFARQTFSTSLLARYSLTNQLAHRFQADLVGGFSLEHSTYHNTGINTYTK